jgi:hypothetical protein
MEQAKVPPTLDKVGADSLLLIFAFLPPLLLITTMERVCKSFSGLRLGSISGTLKRSLCIAFPLMKLEHITNSLLTYDEFKSLYIKFFNDTSTGPFLFSSLGNAIVRKWMNISWRKEDYMNDCCNLGFLRRSGFLCSLYSRVRLVNILTTPLCYELNQIKEHIDNGILDREFGFHDVAYGLMRAIRHAFVVWLLRNSFTISRYPTFHEFFKTGVLDRPVLPKVSPQFLLDVAEPDFDKLNGICSNIETFDFSLIFPDEILEVARVNTPEYKEAILILIQRSHNWFKEDPYVAGIFKPWRYEGVGKYSSEDTYTPTVGGNPYTASVGCTDLDGSHLYWRVFMDQLKASNDWGFMRPYNVKIPEGDDGELSDIETDVFVPFEPWKTYVTSLAWELASAEGPSA